MSRDEFKPELETQTGPESMECVLGKRTKTEKAYLRSPVVLRKGKMSIFPAAKFPRGQKAIRELRKRDLLSEK